MTTWDPYAAWRQSVGYRFVQWTCTMSDLTSDQKARDYERFAAEFDAMPARWEPIDGWSADMAWLCRRGADLQNAPPQPGPG
jgi:hypothetical protein